MAVYQLPVDLPRLLDHLALLLALANSHFGATSAYVVCTHTSAAAVLAVVTVEVEVGWVGRWKS